MGVRGLTKFIEQNRDKYMENYYLHQCYLVIDGNNLAAQLYKWNTSCYDCFGGDYDVYMHTIIHFFDNLAKCNIKPLIVLDGCYENRKLKTIYLRVKDRIHSTKRLNAYTEGSMKVFPLFLRELFSETVIKLGYKIVRCEFEADYEMACIARKLNCPLLSFDSDFYIFDVLYIPFNTLAFECSLRIVNPSDKHPQYVIDCQLYKIENFLRNVGGMDKSVLPLLAVVVGNDYIKADVFRDFYAHLKFVKKRRTSSEQLRKIESVIQWLLSETFDSAARKILGRIKRVHRKEVANLIDEISQGYICEDSKYISYFNIHLPTEEKRQKLERNDSKIDLSTIVEESDVAQTSESNDVEEEEIQIEDVAGALECNSLKVHFPEWFMDRFHSGHFPAWFMDIAVRNRYFFIQQVENYDLPHSHTISLPLLYAMHLILRSHFDNESKLSYVSRGKGTNMESKLLEIGKEFKMPTLIEIPSLSPEELQTILLVNILEFDTSLLTVLEKFDSQWRIFILSLFYWVKNSNLTHKISNVHIYSVIISALTLNHVDRLIGYIRTIKKANHKLKKCRPELVPAINFVKEIIPYFYMDQKMVRNPKGQYDVNIVHPFAVFQSCFYHIKYLNKLLLCPFDDFLVSEFYNGTLVYFVYSSLRKRTDPLDYLKNVLSDSNEIYEYFLNIVSKVNDNLENSGDFSPRRKSGKRRHKQASKRSSEEKSVHNDASKRDNFDPNNRFSILDELY